MTCDIGMVINEARNPMMFPTSFPKDPSRLPSILFITFHSFTLVPLNHSMFLCDSAFVLGDHQKIFDGVAFFEIDLNAHFTICVPETFTQSFGEGYHHMEVVIFIMVVYLLAVVVVSVVVVAPLMCSFCGLHKQCFLFV